MLYIKKILNKLLPECVYKKLKQIRLFQHCIRFYLDSEKSRSADKKRVFLVMTPEHSNLGDHAIAKAELEFLKEYDVYEITGYRLSLLIKCPKILKKMLKNDLIIFNGGGNLGTLWYDAELSFRELLELFPDNEKILFPNTIFYENDDFGKAEFEKSKTIYNSVNNLTLFAREKTSFEIMKSAYNNVYLCPDMVLLLNKSLKNTVRSGVMTLFRVDCEKTISNERLNEINQILLDNFNDIEASDMCSDYSISIEDRDKELEKKFEQFRSKELAVTDRLHGMIFAAITGTPCIVLNSKSPKVKGVYDWIFADCEYITFTDDFKEMQQFISSIKGKSFTYDNSKIKKHYDKLAQIVNESLQEV